MKTAIEITEKFNIKSYSNKDDAFENGNGDNFFNLENGQIVCISENHPVYLELINNGFEDELTIYLIKKKVISERFIDQYTDAAGMCYSDADSGL
jgi:hypothetical protein